MSLKLFVEPIGDKKWLEIIVDNIPHEKSSIENCDYIFSTQIPWSCTDVSFIENVLKSYQNSPKKILVFLVSDYNDNIESPNNIILFRTGLYKSKQKSNEFLLPYIWCQNELKGANQFLPLPKNTIKPTIGFCGYISSHPSRLQHINKLKMSPNVKTNFILRAEFWGGNPYNQTIVNDFIKNIKETHFTLCTRGAGNWSIRFYQVLYLGRIPTIVNTDNLLPFEDKINWRDIIVYSDSVNDISNNIQNFWRSKDIVEVQNKCKEIYDMYLTPEKWCKIIAEELLKYNTKN